MKKLIIALVAGATVFGAVFAVAASLGVTSGVLQSGSDADPTHFSCTPNVTTDYTIAWHQDDATQLPAGDNPGGDYDVDRVVVGGITTACVGGTVFVTLTGSGGAALGSTSAPIIATSVPTMSVPFLPTVDVEAADVTDVHVAITKP